MAITKLDLRMLKDEIEIYFGDMGSFAAVPVWLPDGRVVFVTYGRLQELLGGGGGPVIPPPVGEVNGGFVGVDEETAFVDGGEIGDPETAFFDGGVIV